jgi:hypothetical protein
MQKATKLKDRMDFSIECQPAVPFDGLTDFRASVIFLPSRFPAGRMKIMQQADHMRQCLPCPSEDDALHPRHLQL